MKKLKIETFKIWLLLKQRAIIITTLIAAIAALIGDIKTVVEPLSSLFNNKISVKGIVINSDNTPTENARILLLLYRNNKTDSLNTFSNKEGLFSFNDIPYKNLDSIETKVFWRYKTAFYKRKFDNNINENQFTIKLPNKINNTRANPLSFSYYNLKGLSLDFLLEGKIEPAWEGNLSKNPYIIKNNVFNTLDTIRTKFHVLSTDTLYHELYTDLEVNGEQERVNVSKRPKLYTVGTHDFSEDSFPGYDYYPSADFQIEESEALHFINESMKDKLKKDYHISHSWFLTKSQLTKLRELELKSNTNTTNLTNDNSYLNNTNKLLDFLIFITKDNYPNKFIKAKIASQGDECADLGWTVTIVPPYLSLKAALLENRTKNDLYIGEFFLRNNNTNRLRKENTSLDSTYKLVNIEYPSIGVLKPNEAIIIPLKLILTTALKEEFSFGTSLSIESIIINDDVYAVRKESTQNLVIRNGPIESGSCPYIYTFSKKNNTWLLEDHILYGYDAKEKEKEHILKLKRFNGQLQIRENDPETSFIDYIYVKQVLPNGRTKILKPKNLKINKKDKNYLILNKGDNILIDFSKTELDNGTFFIISHGYYIKYK
ncbi:hypothetical protein [Hymenobacter fodinae]|uniref:Uncharacterized protein n=1 Tax=Hymenobacter fodinae TaxID=2510796 RepID=A0A4Z0P4F7_9BACT|nr:hypothetical protein [Hymenobacter fodinae]TGE06109.1 hypothetical protein EU556_14675 [Hymenobacter fodinae]